MDSRIDPLLNMNSQSWALLHYLAGFQGEDFGLRSEKDQALPPWISTFPWYNGRERGFRIEFARGYSGSVLHVCFAENRGSDSVVVYHVQGDRTYNPQDFKVPDEFWGSARHFGLGKVGEAAEWILTQAQEFAAGA